MPTCKPPRLKDYIICGPEFGLENIGKVALIKRALYGGIESGRVFWHHLQSFMDFLGFVSCRGDPDVWRRAATKKSGEKYHEYILLYVDDCLVVSHKLEAILRKEIGKHLQLKEDSIGTPSQYLGGKLHQVTMKNSQECWAFGSTQYVIAAVDNVK